MKILVDTNVILDVALNRQPFYEASARILGASNRENVHVVVRPELQEEHDESKQHEQNQLALRHWRRASE